MKIMRKIIQIDEERCDGCGQCVPSCAEGAIEVIDGKAKLVEDRYCDGLGACMGDCPNDALTIVEREAEDFDEHAVEKYLEGKAQPQEQTSDEFTMACGCPSTQIQSFSPQKEDRGVSEPESLGKDQSALSHWPVQIRLVPPSAPFLQGAELLILSDCAPVAYPSLHKDFLNGRVALLGCPKFDNAQEYVAKFTDIFRTAGIKSITLLEMEVPCCSALAMIVRKALSIAQADIPLEVYTIGTRGEIVKQEKAAA